MANVHFDAVSQVQAIYARLDALEADGDFGVITRAGGIYSFDTGVVSAFAQTFLNDADAATVRTTIGAAGLASPAFTGTPTAPTAAGGTNTTQIATTAFVTSALAAYTLDGDLTAIAALSSTGIAVRTGTDTWAQRTITGPAAGISVTNGSGAAGNPTLALANDLSALEGLGSTGLAARTGTDTWAQRTITGSAGITVSNGDGVSGNPTLTIAFASQAEAEAGSATDKPMNALRVAQAIAALGGGSGDLPFVTLTSAGGVANAQQIPNKASGPRFSITSGTDTVTATGVSPFVSGDVGKTIVICGAGSAGADLVTTIDGFTSSTVISIATNASTTITTGSEKGLTWGTPAQTALDSAFDTVIAAGGGSVVIDGHFMLTGATSVSLSNAASMVALLGFGSGSRLYICCDSSTDAITFTAMNQLVLVDGVTFVGTTGRRNDAHRTLVFTNGGNVEVRNCGFFGLASYDGTAPAMIRCNLINYRAHGNFFGGCGVGLGSAGTSGVTDHTDWRGVAHEFEQYIDFGQLGTVLHEKSAGGSQPGWIRINDRSNPGTDNITEQSQAVVRKCQFDEGCTNGILINPQSSRDVHNVTVEGCQFNVGGGDTSSGVSAVYTDNLLIRQCWFGWSVNANTFLATVADCGTVTIDSCTTAGAIDTVKADTVAALVIRDTPGVTTLTSATDPGNLYQTPFIPQDSRYGAYALVKPSGDAEDADFIAPPTRGTRVFVQSTGRDYVKKLKDEGWIYFAYAGGEFEGPELVANGDGTSTTGWTAGGGGTHTVTGGRHRITGGGGTEGYFTQTIPVEQGEPYHFDADLFDGTGPALLRVGNLLGGTDVGEWDAGSPVPPGGVDFVADTFQVVITAYVNNGTAGHYAEYDDFTLRAR